MKIIVKQKDQYGVTVFVPVCDAALLFARIAKTKTLTVQALGAIRELGYAVEVKHSVANF